jgi:hypothetical protein
LNAFERRSPAENHRDCGRAKNAPTIRTAGAGQREIPHLPRIIPVVLRAADKRAPIAGTAFGRRATSSRRQNGKVALILRR